jgi:anti-anti-sigma factor
LVAGRLIDDDGRAMPFTRDEATPGGAAGSVVKLTGIVDRATAQSLNALMRDIALGPAPVVVIDISDVEEVNGALLGVLVRTTRWLGWRNGRTVIVCPNAELRRGLEVAGLDHLAEVHAAWPVVSAPVATRFQRGTATRP